MQLFIKNNSDYIGIFKLLTSKKTNFQSLLIVNDLLFYYELTTILKKAEKNNFNFNSELIKFMEKILLFLKSFIDYFRKGLTLLVQKTFYQAYTFFVFQIIKHLNCVEDLLEAKMTEFSCFEFLSLPKITLDLHKTLLEDDAPSILNKTIDKKEIFSNNLVIYSNSTDSEFINIFLKNEEKPDVDISLICFNYKCNYGYEPVNYRNSSHIFTKQTERFLFHLTSSFLGHCGLYMKGPSNSGKKQTFQVIIHKILD